MISQVPRRITRFDRATFREVVGRLTFGVTLALAVLLLLAPPPGEGADEAADEVFAVYENWASGKVRASHWRGGEGPGAQEVRREVVAQPNGKALRMRLRREGGPGAGTTPAVSNFLHLANASHVDQLKATFKVQSLTVTGCADNPMPSRSAAARLELGRFNDGASTRPGDRTGDHVAVLEAFRTSDTSGAPGKLRIEGSLHRCGDSACLTTSVVGGPVSLPRTARVGVGFTLVLTWDEPGHAFRFEVGSGAPATLTYDAALDARPAGEPVAGLAQSHTVAHCTSSPLPGADVETQVGAVRVNLSAVDPTACVAGQTSCPNGGCVDPQTDEGNCGSCGQTCDAGEVCSEGRCLLDGVGAACTESSQCATGQCVDGVCCASACSGVCSACDLAATVGTCVAQPAGTDPDEECGSVSCNAFFAGWVGDTCYRRAAAPPSAVSCTGTNGCQGAPDVCPSQGRGAAQQTCDALCQDPTAGTCTGTTAGACTNVDQGTQSCGTGACATTANICTAGRPATCVPLPPTPETCNDIDDDCDGTIDNGSFADFFEPNPDCATAAPLDGVGSDRSRTYSNMTVYGAGDVDYYRILMAEDDNSCGCGLSTDEDYEATVSLTVPAGAGFYELCMSTNTCLSSPSNCFPVLEGETRTVGQRLDGQCVPGTNDSYVVYVRIRGLNSQAFECRPYTLTYRFDAGLCFRPPPAGSTEVEPLLPPSAPFLVERN